jgi:glycosyltransferase involved in cell wall biosynthesis
VRVALDVTPLIGVRTGVGVFVQEALGALSGDRRLELAGYAVTWRRRGMAACELPDGVPLLNRAMPARPLQWCWQRFDWPPVELFAGSVDVVHGTNFVVPPSRRAVEVVTVHDLTTVRFPELCHPATLAYPNLVRRAVARGAFIHTPSEWVAEETREWLGLRDPSRVIPVHHGAGASCAAIGPESSQPPEGHRPPYLLCLGTVEPRKDIPSVVRAFNTVGQGDPDLSLVVAGPDGWGSQALAEEIAKSPFRERIVRIGQVSEAGRDRLLREASVFVYPSVYEGFGFPPLEAMRAGVPVVATSVGALPEVLGSAALFVEPGDSYGLAEGLSRALGDDALRADLVRAGYERVAQLTWQECGRGLARLYEIAIQARRS